MLPNRAWEIISPGKLELKDLGAVPQPGPHQVLVRIQAVSLNYRDTLVVEHNPQYPGNHKPGLIPCLDGAGVIEQVGQGANWTTGDRVIVHPNEWFKGNHAPDFRLEGVLGMDDRDGTLQTYMILDQNRLLSAPEALSIEEASTLFTAGVTAYRALFYGPLKVEAGMTVLTQGTGGVSCWAILMASAAGAKVVATSSSKEKLEAAQKMGAQHLINYRDTPDWHAEVLKATGGVGVDLVVDVAGAGSIEQSLKSTRFGGCIVNVGLLDEPEKPVSIMPQILYGAKTITGQLGAGSREVAEEAAAFIDAHQLHAPIAKTFKFEEAEQAFEYLKKLGAPGKVVVTV